MMPKKFSKSEHRKRKRKKPESLEKNNGIDNNDMQRKGNEKMPSRRR